MTTYRQAGVNIKRADSFVNRIEAIAEPTHKFWKGSILRNFGGFAAVMETSGVILGVSTDGVGTKACVAAALDYLSTIGQDLVAMNANDLWVTMEPETACMTDYYAIAKLSLFSGQRIIEGIARGCNLADIALVGGETAEMPVLYKHGEFDLAGTIIGIATSHKAVMNPKRDIRPHMGVFGFRSSGVHANGFSLIHKAFGINYYYPNEALIKLRTFYNDLDRPLGDEIMRPTSLYTKMISRLRRQPDIAGFAHITGGGLTRNIPRILPHNCDAVLNLKSWPRHPIFDIIAKTGQVSECEMLKTFNCGIGLVAVSDEDLTSHDFYHIGDIVPGEGRLKTK